MLYVAFLVVWVGFCLVVLVLTTVVFGLLAGRGVVMVLRLDRLEASGVRFS